MYKMMSCAKHQLRLFFVALQFYSRIPIPRWIGFDPAWQAPANRYLPAVGLVVGGLIALVYSGAAWIWPQPVAVIFSMVFGIYLTGAFHEDGLADTCDGFGGGTRVERILEIMKDSRIGAYGAMGIFLVLALKAASLMHMSSSLVPIVLLLAHTLSRFAALTVICRLNYARTESKGKAMAAHPGTLGYLVAFGTMLVVCVAAVAGGWLSVEMIGAGILAASLSTWWMARAFSRRLGGYTGDCLGAIQQVSELAIYLALLGFLG